MASKVEPNYDPSYYERDEGRGTLVRFAAFSSLACEIAVGIISIVTFDGFQECCGESFLYDTASRQDQWEKAIFWTAIAYAGICAIQIPCVLRGSHFHVYNSIIGLAIAYFTIYNGQHWEAILMVALETAATLCESFVLVQENKYSLLCLQIMLMWSACAFTIFLVTSLAKQGGFCIVDGNLEFIFSELSCESDCNDVDVSCSVCDGEEPSCFILF